MHFHSLGEARAQKIRTTLNNNCVVLEASHPSGFSAYRSFTGCGHFAEINRILATQGKELIDWSLDKEFNRLDASERS